MTDHFADRLTIAINAKGAPVCAGIDPVLEKLPTSLWARDANDKTPIDVYAAVDAMSRFVSGIFEAVRPYVPCVKIQSACFERYLWPGVEAYHHLIDQARKMDLIVIADAKRGDIGISAAHYAAGCLADPTVTGLGEIAGPDALTINSYLGQDGIDPFIETANREGKGLFALVRTSNPGGDPIQSAVLADGRRVVDIVAGLIQQFGDQTGSIGECGYSSLGAVVGATKAEDAARLRELMPRQIFLVPGFGAQGGGAKDVLPCFKSDGTGALITASRSIIYAYQKTQATDWQTAIRDAAKEMNHQIKAILA